MGTNQAAELAAIGPASSNRQVGMTRWAILETVKKLYGDPSDAVRELASNSVESIRRAVAAGILAKKDGMVDASYVDGVLTISDNGTGITREEFEARMRVIGTSENAGLPYHGTFGSGFYAHAALSDEVVVDTRTADGTGFRVRCRNGTDWRVLGGPRRGGRGTTISMKTREPKWDKNLGIMQSLISTASYSDTGFRIRGQPVTDWGVFGDRIGHEVGGDTAEFKAGRHAMIEEEWRSSGHAVIRGSAFGVEILLHAARDELFIHDRAQKRVVALHSGLLQSQVTVPFEGLVRITDEHRYRPLPGRITLTPEGEERLRVTVDGLVRECLSVATGITSHGQYLACRDKALFRWGLDNARAVSHKYGVDVATPDMVLSSQYMCFDAWDGDFPVSIRGVLNHAAPAQLVVGPAEHGRTGFGRDGRLYLRPRTGLEQEAHYVARSWGLPVGDA